ncbi:MULTISPECIES: 2-oxoglutarate dehydrogenase E1 component [Sphingobacterium]|uniref:oxoglutarate dehydrogenase (succinyl-transferring) n=1 Tax=Sphingobacterium cellulitidis TaxID=1768011 RepID=A0A8H9G1S8_9SPHI|nr:MULTISPECIES: 2-oxoglutarate dehydrogenase E1 component [Sphingobacterium]MBA8988197.1 2-oxoglutarate dehydrogenase E1 component [Sphingobacterium soli]OYD47504.1 2-oxoglutarate dehydrogenase E1 component [Sphingobacterium cellulitidis]WFB62544.1 2-oxoglutarate dehydrogenase E1 component [Sphingobacterium sp. WM]GGE30538.1 2-oxoglutarate dehydrogenase subunit E1 [Sphingobacterium soli]
MDNLTFLSNADSSYIDGLYQAYKADPNSVDFGWQKFFEGFDFGQTSEGGSVESVEGVSDHALKEINVLNMIHGYRDRGHLFTQTNPVRERRKYYPGKELETFGLSESDMDTVFNAGVEVGLGPAKLRDIRQLIEDTYCRSIGAEFKYIRNPEKIKWLQDHMEADRNQPHYDVDQKKRIFKRLNRAVIFESFLGTKFLGQKRFSLEGAESLIPALDSVIEKGASLGIQEFMIGMAHRGRLNVLANIMGKPYKTIFSEFEGKMYAEEDPELQFGGDVKYHLGYSSDVTTEDGKSIHLSLAPNPSHLETVDPIVEGIVRSKIDMKYNGDSSKIAPILIHGDAAIAGQGVVYEVTQMSKLEGYRTGGTIHIVINNQVGFTTNYKDARSGTYCTDVAKISSSPVFHVNGDDAEAVVYAINLAVEYRQKYKTDVYIDLLCYRRYGHNEADEPKFTQPLLYKAIEKHPNPKDVYAKKLVDEKSIDQNYVKNIEKEFKDYLQEQLDIAKKTDKLDDEIPMFGGAWKGLHAAKKAEIYEEVNTKVPAKEFLKLANEITTLPKDKKFFRKISKLFEDRAAMVKNDNYDWAMGELMAYATLLDEGKRVRISGQDVQRGTFSHRHAVLTLEDSEEKYIPLANVNGGERFNIYNSLLSEYAVLGFEYGYALANPQALTIWEAQFGDFYNGAQIIVDQYLSSAETKWKRSNGLVMMLPHGMEGQGPEHSSGRIERFLELCANDNMIIANCTTPANYFHLLRRQLVREFRKPLVVFTPKSLLRHPKVVSKLDNFTKENFQEVIDDSYAKATTVKRVLFCSGKIYYDLLERQQTEKRTDVAIVRVEQLYPAPVEKFQAIRTKYKKATEFIWVQEENENMGAWPYYCRIFRKTDLDFTDYIARTESGSPATGYMKKHVAQQEAIINKSFE